MKIVVTGGAGFIGSHLVSHCIEEGHEVVVLDDLSSGTEENVDRKADLVVGDVSDPGTVERTLRGADVVLHQAASRAVLKSVEDPLTTDRSNTFGTLNVLHAAHELGIRRVVLASSSSVYGGAGQLPTPESIKLVPKSPYAVSKVAGEMYARVYSELHHLQTVCLRYFNVFGPRQRPDSKYAAVIPLFVDAIRRGESPIVHGDGKQARDFTFISNVVDANMLAISAPAEKVSGNTYNIARGEQISILDLIDHLAEIMDADVSPQFIEPRAGDVRHSCADIEAAIADLGYEPSVGFREGLEATVDWLMRT